MIRNVILVLITLVLVGCNPKPIIVQSPDGLISAEIGIDENDHLFYRIFSVDKEIVPPSRFGIISDSVDLGSGISFGPEEKRSFEETYPVSGIHDMAHNNYNETTVTIEAGEKWYLDIRAFDDGIALRSRLKAKKDRHIQNEVTEWTMPPSTVAWYQDDLRWYEGTFTKVLVDTLKEGGMICLPVSAKLASGKYVLFTEANLVDYTDLAVTSAEDGVFKAFYHAEPQGWKTSSEVVQPWRVTVVTDDLNSLVNSDMIGNLCPPPSPELENASWIKPGRAVWNWWSTPSLIYKEQHKWVDFAKQFGFEYYLIDAGWKKWKDGSADSLDCLTEVVDYARSAGVEIWIWIHSDNIPDKASRDIFFASANKAGVAGIKIDFEPKCTRDVSNWYEATLYDAAGLKLMIDFHGTVKPTGRNRTWPNELTREAVRGHEWHINRYKRTLTPDHDCILPFNRFVIGPADYTPTVFNADELRGYTWSREVAQAIVFTSPLMCYADNPENYLGTPAMDIIKSIPSTWDQTVVLPGSEIGECTAFARRKGENWFIGIINGPKEIELEIPFSFLQNESYSMNSLQDDPDRDDSVTHAIRKISRTDTLRLNIRRGGGFVAHFF